MQAFVRRFLLPLVFVVFVFAVVFALTYWAGTGGLFVDRSRIVVREALPTNPPPLPGTPIAPLEQVNPAVLQAFDRFDDGYGSAGANGVQSIGVYVPQPTPLEAAATTIAATAMPTPFPYPTTPPLVIPDQPDSEMILPTLVPEPIVETTAERTLPTPEILAAVACAPAGNPVDGLLTQRFHRYHLAIDIGVPRGTAVLATHSGQVIYADWSDIGYGYLVIVQSGAFITYYAHNSSFNVTTGQYVGKGSILAWSGSTGNSSGPHVHYEIRINDVNVDPMTFESRGYGTC